MRYLWLNLSLFNLVLLLMAFRPTVLPPQASPRLATPSPQPTVTVDLVKHVGGSIGAVFIQGHYAYVGFGSELVILDVSQPAQPVRVGSFLPNTQVEISGDKPAGFIRDITVVPPYAYLATDDLWVVDVSDPTQPALVGYLPNTGGSSSAVATVAVVGQYAYLLKQFSWPGGGGSGHGFTNSLHIVDISKPAHPVDLSFIDVSSGNSGEIRNMLVVGNYVYIPNPKLGWGDGLDVIDVSNPAQPVKAANWTGEPTEAIVAKGDVAYVSGGYWGQNVQIVDMAALPALRSLGLYQTSGKIAPGEIAAAGDKVYFTQEAGPQWDWNTQGPFNEYGLRIIDVADPARPRPLGFYPTQAVITDVAIVGNYAYFITAGQLHILDVSTPAAPTEVGVYQTLSAAYDLNLAGETLYVAENDTLSNLQAVNISNPASPIAGGRLTGQVKPIGNGYAYRVDEASLQIVSLEALTAPLKVYRLDEKINQVVNKAPYLYVLLTPRRESSARLAILDASNPANLREIGRFNLPADSMSPDSLDPQRIAVVGNYLYLIQYATDESGARPLRIFKMVDAHTLVEESRPDKILAWDVLTVYKNYAYLTTPNQLQILDVTQPAQPIKMGSIELGVLSFSPAGREIVIDESYAYVLDTSFGLRVVDISNPAQPIEVGGAYLPFYTWYWPTSRKLIVAQDYIYIAADEKGLYIFQVKKGPK